MAGHCFVKVTHPPVRGRNPGGPSARASLSKGVLRQVQALAQRGRKQPRQGGVWKRTLPSEARSALGRSGGSTVASSGPLPCPLPPLPSVLEWQVVGFRTTFPPTSRFVCTLSVTLPSHLRGNLELLGKG